MEEGWLSKNLEGVNASLEIWEFSLVGNRMPCPGNSLEMSGEKRDKRILSMLVSHSLHSTDVLSQSRKAVY